jgi:hypothetical protein
MTKASRITMRGCLLVAMLLGIQRTAFAEIDLSGDWLPIREEDNTGNTELGDWVGIPMSEASRQYATAYDPEIWTLPEWQCRPHGSGYISRGPSQLKIWKEVDAASRNVTAWHLEWLRSVDRPVYMDGRPHPSANAPHTWAGFSTGEWVGDILRIRVTHLKKEYLKRNGVFHSDKAELTQYLIRRDNRLTYVLVEYDPIYLTEPLIRSTEYQLGPNYHLPPYPCTAVTEIDRPNGVIPSHLLPDPNPDVTYYSKKYHIPMDVVTAGAATMYPEIRNRIPRSMGGFAPDVAEDRPRQGEQPARRSQQQ